MIDFEGHHAYQILVGEYFRARMEGQEQRQQDLREAIELCWPEDWAIQRAETRRLRGPR